MIRLSDLTSGTPPSGIRAIFNRIAESKDVISLALGEPDSTTPKACIDAAIESMEMGNTHYTPNAGIWDLRTAIAEYYKKRHIRPEQVIVTAGATEALLLIFMTILNPGDEVIVAEPYWPTYLGQIKAVGAVPRFVRTCEEDGFVFSIEKLKAAINEKTRMILLNSPSNPTGALMCKSLIEEIAKLVVQHDLIVISDEVYHRMIYDHSEFHSIYDEPGMTERCLIVDSFSKTYAMTGWRVGYIIAPEDVAKALESMHEYGVSCISEPAQRAAIAALEHGEIFVRETVDSLKRRRDIIVDGLSKIPGIRCRKPEATFYLYFNVSDTGMTSHEFVYGLLETQKIALAPGTAFGDGQEAYVRLSFACPEETLHIAIERIEAFLHKNIACRKEEKTDTQ